MSSIFGPTRLRPFKFGRDRVIPEVEQEAITPSETVNPFTLLRREDQAQKPIAPPLDYPDPALYAPEPPERVGLKEEMKRAAIAMIPFFGAAYLGKFFEKERSRQERNAYNALVFKELGDRAREQGAAQRAEAANLRQDLQLRETQRQNDIRNQYDWEKFQFEKDKARRELDLANEAAERVLDGMPESRTWSPEQREREKSWMMRSAWEKMFAASKTSFERNLEKLQAEPQIEQLTDEQLLAMAGAQPRAPDTLPQQAVAAEERKLGRRLEADEIAKVDAMFQGSGQGPGLAGAEDVTSIADAIESGIQPPTISGLYRYGAPVRAELGRRKYDLATAQRDWTAIQRHMSTLNGPQQERLRQAVAFTYDSLTVIEDLFNEWKKVVKPSGFPLLNRLTIISARNLPGRAGEIAVALEAQINDLTSELGTVYKGGNASTDESLRLAAENLKAHWNEGQFKKQLELIRQNLQIRKNSILTSRPTGVSPGSPYLPPIQPTPTPTDRGKGDPLGIR